MRPERGFSLLEALVALVILGGAGMALFSWINVSLVSLQRVEDANARSEAIANVVEHMQSVNPMLAPRGTVDFGRYTIDWDVQPVTNVVDGAAYPRGLSQYQLALYDAQVRAAKPGDSSWFELKLLLVGYKRVRMSMTPL